MGSDRHQRSIDGYTVPHTSRAPIVREASSSRTWGDGRPPWGHIVGSFPRGGGRGLARLSTRFIVRLIFLGVFCCGKKTYVRRPNYSYVQIVPEVSCLVSRLQKLSAAKFSNRHPEKFRRVVLCSENDCSRRG
jgi:hypothetical protein